MTNTAAMIFIVATVIAYTGLIFQGQIMRYFNLADKRKLIGSETTVARLNTLLDKGDVTLYSHEFMAAPRITLSLTYNLSTRESVNNRFEAKSIDEAVDNAWAWSTKIGMIKE